MEPLKAMEEAVEKLRRAIIMAAGEGSRLRPVTLETPKPLVSVNGTRMIDTEINALKSNGIHEIYIVTGYKSEKFKAAFSDDPDITILDNPYYLKGNNVTSLYVARDYLPGSFILEGDLNVFNENILDPAVSKSGYCASREAHTSEWSLELENDSIVSYSTSGGDECYRLWGVSMWTVEDGLKLSELVRTRVEDIKDWSDYWDTLALSNTPELFDLGIREIGSGDIIEIDSYEELLEADPSYAGKQF